MFSNFLETLKQQQVVKDFLKLDDDHWMKQQLTWVGLSYVLTTVAFEINTNTFDYDIVRIPQRASGITKQILFGILPEKGFMDTYINFVTFQNGKIHIMNIFYGWDEPTFDDTIFFVQFEG